MSFDIKEYHAYEKKYGEELNTSTKFVFDKIGKHDIAVVLGSGLNDFYDELQDRIEILYKDIPMMPLPTIAGHRGKLVSGKLAGRKILCFAGRTHSYEGISFHEVCFQTRMSAVLGIKVFGLTNATGGTLDGMYPSCIMSIRDHFKFLSRIDPLRELLPESLLDVTKIDKASCWNEEFFKLSLKLAEENDIDLFEGVYTWTSGPSFETPLEVAMSKDCGGGALGMSTVPEVLVARACGMETFGMSCCTNLGAGMSKDPPTHEEVMEMAKKGAPKFRKILRLMLENLPIPQENSEWKEIKVKEVYEEKPFPFTQLASSVKIAAGTVMKKLANLSRVAVIIDKSHLAYLDTLSDKTSIKFTDIPNFPSKSFPSEDNMMFSGVTTSGQRIYVIVCEKVVGFVTEEASFFSLILYELGVKFVIMAIVASRSTSKVEIKENVVGLEDFTNFTYASRQFKVLYRFCEPSRQALQDPFVSDKLNKYYGKDLPRRKLMSFYSYAFPSLAERNFSVQYGADMVAITALTPLYTAKFLGIETVPLVTLSKNDSTTMSTNTILSGIDKDVIADLNDSINKILDNAAQDIYEMKLEQLALPESLPDRKKYGKPSNKDQIHEAFDWIKSTLGVVGKIENAYIDFDLDISLTDLNVIKSVSLEDIPNLKFHGKKKNPRLVFGTMGDKQVLAILGTAFSHEYTSCVELTLLMRCFFLFGVANVYMSASFLQVDPKLDSNAVVMVSDHINFTGRNPLIGPNIEEFGPRFPEMSSVHDDALANKTKQVAQGLGIEITSAGLFQTSGGMLYSKMDHDAALKFRCGVVNSLGVHEIIVAGHCGIRVCYVGAIRGKDMSKSVEKIISGCLTK